MDSVAEFELEEITSQRIVDKIALIDRSPIPKSMHNKSNSNCLSRLKQFDFSFQKKQGLKPEEGSNEIVGEFYQTALTESTAESFDKIALIDRTPCSKRLSMSFNSLFFANYSLLN
jgi:hypothetical protein